MFQMQSWDASAACTCPIGLREEHDPKCPYPAATHSWVPMEDGAAKAHWKPKKTPQDAVYQAMRWTGLIAIPAMQVVNLETGEVVWRDPGHDDAAGPAIEPEWAAVLRRQVRREQALAAQTEAEARDPKPRPGSAAKPQGQLF